MSLCYKICDQHEDDGKWGQITSPSRNPAECEQALCAQSQPAIGIIFACSVRGAWSKERSDDQGTCTTRG